MPNWNQWIVRMWLVQNSVSNQLHSRVNSFPKFSFFKSVAHCVQLLDKIDFYFIPCIFFVPLQTSFHPHISVFCCCCCCCCFYCHYSHPFVWNVSVFFFTFQFLYFSILVCTRLETRHTHILIEVYNYSYKLLVATKYILYIGHRV